MKSIHEIRLGVLGGGQLARMLALKAHDIALEVWVMSESPKDPAAQVTSNWVRGSLHNPENCRNFFSKLTHVTFESEFCDCSLLKDAADGLQIEFAPKLETLHALQDRWTQKKILREHDIPSAPYIQGDSPELEAFLKRHRYRVAVKKRRFGYDGYGTFLIRSKIEWEDFSARSAQLLRDSILEPLLDFKRELAVSLARNSKGQTVFLPLVESHQEKAKCLWVKGPVHHKTMGGLIKKLKSFAKKINYQGLLSFELFDTGKDLLVNELAPRVHNSAHYSMDALSHDQFHLHLLAACDLPLFKPELLGRGFAMYNLLGKSTDQPLIVQPKLSKLHWYGKTDGRPGRKMGHLNAVGSNPEQALQRVRQDARRFRL